MRIFRPIAVLAVLALILSAAAAAKEFRPGDLRICNAKRCVAITDQGVLDTLSAFYYGDKKPGRVSSPRRHVPYFKLEFTNGYVTGIVARSRLDRFLSYGVNLDQFQRGRWYAVPASAALALQRLASGLKPLRLSQTAVGKSH